MRSYLVVRVVRACDQEFQPVRPTEQPRQPKIRPWRLILVVLGLILAAWAFQVLVVDRF